MKKTYNTPELEVEKFTVDGTVFTVSETQIEPPDTEF